MAKKKTDKSKKVNVTLVRSTAGSIMKHKATVRALGLRKIGQTVEHTDNEKIRGMINSVQHLVKVEE